MDSSIAQAPVPGAADLAGLEPIERIRNRWPMFLGGALTLLMIVALGHELFNAGLAGLSRTIPSNPLFYLAFASYYLAPPTFDYLIFRRLWGIPLAGMAALHKKRIANEVLLGYSGEAYFYAWARQRTQMVAAPFGAVKDVMIQSAIAGNTFTLALILLVAPFAATIHQEEVNPTTIAISAAVMIAMCVPFLLFSRRVFSLSKTQLWWVYGMHMTRLSVVTLSVAFAWHFAIPGVSMGTWIFLAAVRMLTSRLPFVPNKELMFASIAIVLIGSGEAVTELLALVAGLTLLAHIVLIAGFSLHGLWRRLA
ncbi:hypothetical protein [Sphingomonas sp.]|uniref:hypothetical protein n=1 Tax=Sphingomonas sp. TaxID=28214 RepID=UPI001B009775|nr:hypothetical protein [Sphingomonas sp.]MBO9713020.1 hypothetical protein [Sphingomonas sp.]